MTPSPSTTHRVGDCSVPSAKKKHPTMWTKFHILADEYAIAIAAACRETGEHFEDLLEGVHGIRARWYAGAALLEIFPKAYHGNIARTIGFRGHKQITTLRGKTDQHRRHSLWWNEQHVVAVHKAILGYLDGSSNVVAIPAQTEAPTSVLMLTNATCRWPIGDPRSPDFRYCGAAADLADKRPYCDHHASVSRHGSRVEEDAA